MGNEKNSAESNGTGIDHSTQSLFATLREPVFRSTTQGRMVRNGFLKRLGIVRNAIRKDILYFFLPWLTVFYIELYFCERYGNGLSGFWGIIWGLVKQPQHLFMFPVQSIIGMALIIIGLIIMIVSQATLWQNYSSFVIIRKDHQLITHGIYRFTRNPIYLGAIMVFAGLPVYAASLYGFLTMLAFLLQVKQRRELSNLKINITFAKMG